MKTLSKRQFLAQVQPQGIMLDQRYQPPQTLVYAPETGCCHSWDLPSRIKDLPHWTTRLIQAAQLGAKSYLYPREGAWSSGDSQKLFLMHSIFTACQVAPAPDVVLEADQSDVQAVEGLFFLTLVHGGTVSDDVFLVPDHGKVILWADHHETVFAEFANREFMEEFLKRFP